MNFINLNKIVLFVIITLTLITITAMIFLSGFKNPFLEKELSPVKTEASSTTITPSDSYNIVIQKSKRTLSIYDGKKKLLKSYKIALGFNPTGTKLKQGDGATPEGDYYLTHKNARSKFYLSLGVSFPNSKDAESGLQSKLISRAEKVQIITANNHQQKPPQNTKLGGDIFLHGGGTSSDWTWGCVALSNEDIKELFDLLPLKTRIKIEP